MALDEDIERLLSLRGDGQEYVSLLGQVRSRIQAGERSGDVLRDFLLLSLGICSGIEDSLRDLASRIVVGEYVFLERTMRGLRGFPGIIAPAKCSDKYVVMRSRVLFGKASDEVCFDFEKRLVYVPCEKFTLLVDGARRMAGGPMCVDPVDVQYYGQIASSQVDRGFMAYDLSEYLRSHPCPFTS